MHMHFSKMEYRKRTEPAWAKTVAYAAPAARMPSGPISNKSKPIFRTQATPIKSMGDLESPKPLKIEEI